MTLFHYCSAETFSKILENGCVWFTDLSKSRNDKTEGQYIKCIFRRAWKRFAGERTFDEAIFDTFDKFLDTHSILGMCTSKNGDFHSQWDEYANHGTGFSIGFEGPFRGSHQDHTKASRFPLSKGEIEYEIEQQINALEPYIPEILMRCDDNGIQKSLFYMPERYEISWLTINGCFGRIVREIAYTIKPASLSRENEVRFFFNLLELDTRKEAYQSFCRNSEKVDYIPVPLSELPRIGRVIIGPKNNTDESDVKCTLEAHDIYGVEPEKSAVSY